MQARIIYEQVYPRMDMEEAWRQAQEESENAPAGSSQEHLAAIPRDMSCRPIPERAESSKQFVRSAIAFSQRYQIDTKILRYYDRITVQYRFDCFVGTIKPVFTMADECSIFQNGSDVQILLDYFTHALVLGGKVIAPIPDPL